VAASDWELDHVFFATEEPDHTVRALEEHGFVFERRGSHAGQGTANHCAVFENAFVEILRARDRRELQSDLVRPLGLDDRIRWRETGACPFGLCFRPTTGANAASTPFRTWAYRAPYLRPGSGIPIVTPAGAVGEPLVFLSDDPEPRWRAERDGLRCRITAVRVRRPASSLPLSVGIRWFTESGLFLLEDGSDHHIELEWDGGHRAQIPQLAPEIPIALRW
jgi:hypothetical protein